MHGTRPRKEEHPVLRRHRERSDESSFEVSGSANTRFRSKIRFLPFADAFQSKERPSDEHLFRFPFVRAPIENDEGDDEERERRRSLAARRRAHRRRGRSSCSRWPCLEHRLPGRRLARVPRTIGFPTDGECSTGPDGWDPPSLPFFFWLLVSEVARPGSGNGEARETDPEGALRSESRGNSRLRSTRSDAFRKGEGRGAMDIPRRGVPKRPFVVVSDPRGARLRRREGIRRTRTVGQASSSIERGCSCIRCKLCTEGQRETMPNASFVVSWTMVPWDAPEAIVQTPFRRTAGIHPGVEDRRLGFEVYPRCFEREPRTCESVDDAASNSEIRRSSDLSVSRGRQQRSYLSVSSPSEDRFEERTSTFEGRTLLCEMLSHGRTTIAGGKHSVRRWVSSTT